jgi:uridine phosphorylase
MNKIPESELILNSNGSIYHLNLKPEDIAHTIILVGDKDRVPLIGGLFDQIEIIKEKREFVTLTGIYKGKRISVISTGIGTDNIDIVVNELDALVNIDFKNRTLKEEPISLNLIRIGTCGTIDKNIPVESFIVSDYSLGFDNLISFYKSTINEEEKHLCEKIKAHLHNSRIDLPIYLFSCSEKLKLYFSGFQQSGITVTSPGFFGPQCRTLRAPVSFPNLIDSLSNFSDQDKRIVNFEMETSAIYGLSRILGHHAITIDLVLANRVIGKTAVNYHEKMKNLAEKVLDIIANEIII